MKKTLLTLIATGIPTLMMAQAAVDAARLSQIDNRGTARFISMGGAFTALGGDISTLNQNPAGIGVFRGNEVSLTLNLDAINTETSTPGYSNSVSKTKFNFQNFGFIGTINLHSDATPTLSFGASYNRLATFNRIVNGRFNFGANDRTSLSNYIAAMANSEGPVNSKYLKWDGPYDGYNPYMGDNTYQPSWLTTLGYQGFVINDVGEGSAYHYQGLGDATSSLFRTQEKGYVDEYNISVGGNLYNLVYWGIGVGITDIDYKQYSYYEETIQNGQIAAQNANATGNNDPYYLVDGRADYRLSNFLQSSGTGYNIKLGVIVKPINQLRIGFAFHTPTWYKMTDTYWGDIDYRYTPDDNTYAVNASNGYGPLTNDGSSWNDYNLRTPWRMMFGIAGVIGNRAIISADYEIRGNDMRVSDPYGDEYTGVSADIKTYYKKVSVFRLGAEYRVTPQLSLRAGYSYQSSPVQTAVENDGLMVWTAGTIPSYSFENTANQYSLGVGYKFSKFYLDLAYVYRTRESTWHAYSPILVGQSLDQSSPSASVKNNASQVYLTFGYKF